MANSYNRHGGATRPETGRPWLLVETGLATLLALYGLSYHGATSGFLLLPVAILVATRRPFGPYGLDVRLFPPSFRGHAGIAAGAAALTVGFHWLIRSGQEMAPALPEGLLALAAVQLLAVALPEELFFRAYLQTNLDRAFGRPWTVFGAPVGPGWVLQAVLFALFHLVFASWGQLHVLAFGLLAGWLRARSGSIAAPVLYHAAGNVLVAVIAASFS